VHPAPFASGAGQEHVVVVRTNSLGSCLISLMSTSLGAPVLEETLCLAWQGCYLQDSSAMLEQLRLLLLPWLMWALVGFRWYGAALVQQWGTAGHWKL